MTRFAAHIVQPIPAMVYDLRMSGTGMTSEAARQLVRARWGTTRLDGMISELRARTDELGPAQVAELQALVHDKTTKEQDR